MNMHALERFNFLFEDATSGAPADMPCISPLQRYGSLALTSPGGIPAPIITVQVGCVASIPNPIIPTFVVQRVQFVFFVY